ncbi:MAG: hypothetical protein KDK36_05360, partial [Leptospiraceae bacterium]|nr:hypothetical protein [Leptospiraceae bacterium]
MANNLKVIIQPGQKLIFTPNPAKRKVILKKENCNDLHDELKKWKDKYSELLKNSRSKKYRKQKDKSDCYEHKSKAIFWENKYKGLRKDIDDLVEEYSNQNSTEKEKESPLLLPDNSKKSQSKKKVIQTPEYEKDVIPINDFYNTGDTGLESVLKIMECYNRIKTFTRKDIVLNKITKDDLYNAALDKGFVPDDKKEKINYLRILLDIYEGFCFITAQKIVTDKTLDSGIKFNNILMLYNNMPSNNVRTTESVSLQQYSTPLPLSFLISQYLYDNHGYNLDVNIFEPTAGTGNLLLRSSYYPDNRNIIVNELDSLRYNILRAIKTKWKSWIGNTPNEIITLNGDIFDIYSKNSFGEYGDLYNSDFIFMNPPFGSYKNKSFTQYVNIEKGKYAIPKLEQGIATYCLKFLKQKGIMAIILGGHTLKKNKYQGYEIANRNDIPFLKYIYTNH